MLTFFKSRLFNAAVRNISQSSASIRPIVKIEGLEDCIIATMPHNKNEETKEISIKEITKIDKEAAFYFKNRSFLRLTVTGTVLGQPDYVDNNVEVIRALRKNKGGAISYSSMQGPQSSIWAGHIIGTIFDANGKPYLEINHKPNDKKPTPPVRKIDKNEQVLNSQKDNLEKYPNAIFHHMAYISLSSLEKISGVCNIPDKVAVYLKKDMLFQTTGNTNKNSYNCSDGLFKVIFGQEMLNDYNPLGTTAAIIREVISCCLTEESAQYAAYSALQESGVGLSLKEFSSLTFNKKSEFEQKKENLANNGHINKI